MPERDSQSETQAETPSEVAVGRRSFLKGASLAGGAAAFAGSVGAPAIVRAQTDALQPRQTPLPLPGMLTGRLDAPVKANHWYVPASDKTVHWGYYSKLLKPVIEIESGDYVTLECLTHMAGDDPERMIKGDPGAESVYYWTKEKKNIERRGAGPMNAPAGAGGDAPGVTGAHGVHILTGPIAVRGAAPGDVLEVRILDMYPRPSGNPEFKNKCFGSNLAAHWGYHYHDLIEEPKGREVVTIYEIDTTHNRDWAKPVYNYRWGPYTDPSGILHTIYDYPGLPVDPKQFNPKFGILKNVRVPIRPHFGSIGLAPKEVDAVTSIPPSYTGGNIDDWRVGKGATLYLPVSVEGALLSAGDTHACQGDSELCGTAIESSWTGLFQIIVHKQKDLEGTMLAGLDAPMLETKDEWVVHGFSYPNYLAQLGPNAQYDIFKKSSLDNAMRDAYRKIRNFLMKTQNLSEDEAISLISVAVDFGVTQVVDANFGVHATLKKRVFAGEDR
jgi:acetamidase/formamidase